MTLHELNAASDEEAKQAFLKCCGSQRWASEMNARRPFAAFEDVIAAADAVDALLDDDDWLEAFAAHPRIGQASSSAWSQREQAAALHAEDAVKEKLSRVNRDYEEKYGFIFIVFASGKSPEHILEIAEQRMKNSQKIEIHNAAREQQQITRARLHKLLGI